MEANNTVYPEVGGMFEERGDVWPRRQQGVVPSVQGARLKDAQGGRDVVPGCRVASTPSVHVGEESANRFHTHALPQGEIWSPQDQQGARRPSVWV